LFILLKYLDAIKITLNHAHGSNDDSIMKYGTIKIEMIMCDSVSKLCKLSNNIIEKCPLKSAKEKANW